MPDADTYLSAEQAAETLGISRATLYSYVSRGLIRAVNVEGDPRRRLYDLHDIEQMRRRKSVGRRPRDVAATTLDWGFPVLSSGISQIERGRLGFRGQDAVDWAGHATLEDTARLLWSCGDSDPFAGAAAPEAGWDGGLLERAAGLPLTERCQALLPFVAAGRATAWQRASPRLWHGAVALLRATAAAASGTAPGARPVHEHLSSAWGLDPAAEQVVRRALVLLADHELNASAFAVRVVASTGASLGACLTAGLSALSGPLHGGTISLVERLLEDCHGDAEAEVETRLRRGEGVPGFGHPLYPDGDPRAAALLPLLPPDPERDALVSVMAETVGKLPNVDFALAAIRLAFDLPKDSGHVVFAVGRTVGWIAHALEQYGEGKLIRPRAQYTGPAPGRDAEM
ncbi:citrate synthase family protein [Salipiger abyssi]|uniref:citrate synthase (unknown stereospecificity) n=1 Tax=Salipiger abyssi TaxID=1250539 RepID=A0A1P8UPA0_9RHOB|nr:citrate synthase family protein [Salipiger abyssi]APZ51178.1 citrate synthase [Salipiger abyssi]